MHAMHITKLYSSDRRPTVSSSIKCFRRCFRRCFDIRELDNRSRVPTFPDRHVPDCDSRHQHHSASTFCLVVVSRAHNHTPPRRSSLSSPFLFRACIQAQHPDLPRPTSHAAIIHDRKFGSSCIDAVMRRSHAAVPGSYRVEWSDGGDNRYLSQILCRKVLYGYRMGDRYGSTRHTRASPRKISAILRCQDAHSLSRSLAFPASSAARSAAVFVAFSVPSGSRR